MPDREDPTATDRGGEADIAVHWQEEPMVAPPRAVRRPPHLADPTLKPRFASARFPGSFEAYAEMLTWSRRWDRTLDADRPPFYRWFPGGRLNASVNCIDRHLPDRAASPALVFVPEPESEAPEVLTYQDLYDRVNALAAYLHRGLGAVPGERVTLHLPMTPELPIAMLACARLGLPHSVVFSGFSGEACGLRIADSQSRFLITMDGYFRNGRWVDLRRAAERAYQVAHAEGHPPEKVLVLPRRPGHGRWEPPLRPRVEIDLEAELQSYRSAREVAQDLPSDHPLFLMYTSGTTGRPKGVQHNLGGYLAYAAGTTYYYQDLDPDDVYWCMADIGWITGHTYIVYGPLALGAQVVLYEGVPTWPDAERPWRISEQLGVTVFHTSPTAIRQLRRLAPSGPGRHRTRFRLLTSVGEPIEPETWHWYFSEVGRGRAALVDAWWQTETGGILCATAPGVDPMKPGSAGPGALGIFPEIRDEEGRVIPPGSGRAGALVIPHPWPGQMAGIWGDPQRYVETYYRRFNLHPESTDWRDWPYVTGDGAVQAMDGYIRILGRMDDVINVAGHRLGAKEIESACLTVHAVAEAAVVPVSDPVKGRCPEVYIALRPGFEPSLDLADRVTRAVETTIGKIARPTRVWFVPDMPKTRSGKILRRVLAAISNRRPSGDLTTLANPEVVAEIEQLVRTARERSDAEAGRQ